MAQIFALLDCNNFYVSCERLFSPRLEGRPVVVLSNNDGCIIARSNEAKELGIKMGAPFFQCRELMEAHQVQVFSSNYPLYGDLSQRVMGILSQLEPEVDIYSIDEAFFRQAKGKPQALLDNGRHIRATVRKQVGIPVSIGFGSTKTLAKIANRIAKKQPEHGGIFVLPEENLEAILATIEVGEVWGIGPRHSQKLFTYGIRTALDLKNANDTWLRKHLTITGLRTAMELRGVSCLPFEEVPAPRRKSVTSSRSFGQPVTDLSGLREALSAYVSIAAEKLRAEHKKAGCLQVYLTTNRFRDGEPQYANSLTVNLPNPTASTLALIHHASEALRQLYRPGFSYRKVGVILVDLVASSHEQQHLFRAKHEEQGELMAALDKINRRWGRDTLQSGSAGFKRPWKNKQTRKSPSYTTSWHELPVVR
ncbi:MAG: SOS mutagenesis and repair protein UmuC [Deltaproteobacteria bacterium RIFOXYD12_FULL_56_24]|nr:MAG: SOS mutagenesis and repair protein UmuC [Deltaproteobacteria bacterium RIFOXYD12_FULL_56_24]